MIGPLLIGALCEPYGVIESVLLARLTAHARANIIPKTSAKPLHTILTNIRHELELDHRTTA